MDQMKINLSLDETNIVLNALGDLPYKQVFQLIQKIQQQAGRQLESDNGQEVTADKEHGVPIN